MKIKNISNFISKGEKLTEFDKMNKLGEHVLETEEYGTCMKMKWTRKVPNKDDWCWLLNKILRIEPIPRQILSVERQYISLQHSILRYEYTFISRVISTANYRQTPSQCTSFLDGTSLLSNHYSSIVSQLIDRNTLPFQSTGSCFLVGDTYSAIGSLSDWHLLHRTTGSCPIDT